MPGSYELVEKLGEGGLGEVWKARHTAIAGQYRALKVVQGRELGAYLRREANTLARMSHANVIRVYDFFEDDGKSYLVEELFPSVSLRQKMRASGGRLGEIMAEHYARQYLAALAYAHGHPEGPIVHGDFKPENVLIGEKDSVKVVDFGFATKPDSDSNVRVSTKSSKKGFITPEYMPPEQKAGAKLTPASDVYSAGLTLYESLTGRTMPFIEISPPKLWRIARKAVEPEPEGRYPTAKEMLADLEGTEEKIREKPSPKTTALFAPKPKKSYITSPPVLGGALALLLSAGIAFVISSNRRGEGPVLDENGFPARTDIYVIAADPVLKERPDGSATLLLKAKGRYAKKTREVELFYDRKSKEVFLKSIDADGNGIATQDELNTLRKYELRIGDDTEERTGRVVNRDKVVFREGMK
jgi:serine/threonine-protein kinase